VNVGVRPLGPALALELVSDEARMSGRLTPDQADAVAAHLTREAAVARAVAAALAPRDPEPPAGKLARRVARRKRR